MRALLIGATAAILLIAASAAAAAGPTLRERTCNGYVYSATEPTAVKIARGSTTCSTAKRIFKAYFRSKAPCEGSSCLRKHSGWTCQTAAAFAYPRVASCWKGKTTIEAWAIVD